MITGFFAEKPRTRLSNAPELNRIAVFLDHIEQKEIELAKQAKSKGAGSADYRKHIVVKTLWTELKKQRDEFNNDKSAKNNSQNKQDMIKFVQSMHHTVNKNLDLFATTLDLQRNENRENLRSLLHYGSLTAGVLTSWWLALSTLGSIFTLFFVAPWAKRKIIELIGVESEHAATTILLKAFAKELVQAGENLGLAKHWHTRHRSPNALDFEDDLLCPINKVMMEEPTFCLLDERTYEKEAITKWLIAHRSSPFNPSAKLSPGQAVSEVLAPNRNLKNVIETICKAHPEYKDQQYHAASLSP